MVVQSALYYLVASISDVVGNHSPGYYTPSPVSPRRVPLNIYPKKLQFTYPETTSSHPSPTE